MFGQKTRKPPAENPQRTGADAIIQKLADLPPVAHLLVAATTGGYAMVAIMGDGAKFIGLVCLLIGLTFALLGINAVLREMRALKLIESHSTPQILRSMKRKQLEEYLCALLALDGYRVRSAVGELDRFDDADLIAEGKNQTLLIQFNHFDEDLVDNKPIQSLHAAAGAVRATGCLAITFGTFSMTAIDWAKRKDVTLLNVDDIIAMARRLLGKVGDGRPRERTEALDPRSRPGRELENPLPDVAHQARHTLEANAEKNPEY